MALEEAFVSRVLDQRMFENVVCLGRRAPREDELGCDQSLELPTRAAPLVEETDSSSRNGNSRPIAAPICATPLTGASRSSRAIGES
jgi:hypothetical protein